MSEKLKQLPKPKHPERIIPFHQEYDTVAMCKKHFSFLFYGVNGIVCDIGGEKITDESQYTYITGKLPPYTQ
jgi:hypothetical protein